MKTMELNPKLDLTFERLIDVPPHLVWRAWTEPDLIKQWFCPLPWKTIHADVDVRPGGKMHTVMQSPEGQEFPGTGCKKHADMGFEAGWSAALDQLVAMVKKGI